MSFADLTPEAYEAAERAAWGIVRQYSSFDLEFDEVYYEALLYLAERPHIVPREMAKGQYATANMRKLVYEALSARMAAEGKRQGRETSYEAWEDHWLAQGA